MPSPLACLLLALAFAPQDPADLDRALRAGDVEALEALAAAPQAGARALARAVELGAVEAIELLLEFGVSPDAPADDFGTRPLMVAVNGSLHELGRLLLERGADPDARDVLGDPALNWAAYMGDARFVTLLLEAGADPALTSPHGDAMGIALRRGNWGVVDALLAARGVEEDPLLAGVLVDLRAGSSEALERWLAGGGAADARDAAGTPLVVHAAAGGSPAGVEALLAAGADVDQRDAIGYTALFAATRRGSPELVAALLAAGARADRIGDPRGMSISALFLAGESGRTDLIALLVEAGAPLDARNTLGQSALGWSLAFGRVDSVELLLDLGAGATHVDALGRTPAALARQAGMEELAQRLEARAAGER